MARATTQNSVIRALEQRVYVDGRMDRDLWCTSVNYGAGVGTSTATFTVPYAYANSDILSRYRYKKVTVIAGTGGAARTLFVGYISGDSSDASEADDGVTLAAHTAGRFLTKRDVGEDVDHWRACYRLFDDLAGKPTGWTPLRVLVDLWKRLPKAWQDELKLGDVRAISNAQDLPVQNYDFSLTSYADAIDGIASSLGDVMVVERFAYDATWLDFVLVNAANAPSSFVTVARWNADTGANVARFSEQYTLDPTINQAVVFGTDKEFLITARSVVADFPNQSSPTPETALIDDWDPALEPVVLADPDLAKSDKVARTCVVKEWLWANTCNDGDTANPPGSSPHIPEPGTLVGIAYVKCGIDLIPHKTVLVHSSGERLLVTSYEPGHEAWPASPPDNIAKTEKHALVFFDRMYQAKAGDQPGNILIEDALQIEMPGLSNVFRRYKLPECLKSTPEREFQSSIPSLDKDGNRRKPQSFVYSGTLVPWPSMPDVREAVVTNKPKLVEGTRFEFGSHRVMFAEATVGVKRESRDIKENSDSAGKVVKKSYRVTKTYQRVPCGVTFSYIDPFNPFGYKSPLVSPGVSMPFAQRSRQKFDEYVYQQATNLGYPIGGEGGVVFDAIRIGPETGDYVNGYKLYRNDAEPLITAAMRELQSKYRVGYSATVEIPWVDTNYAVGQQLKIKGLENPPRDRITITGASYNMAPDGVHTTTLYCDNQRPPKRQRFETKTHFRPTSPNGRQA